MRVLGLDSATNVGSVALVEEGRLLAEVTFNIKKNHSERLMPMLAWMLEEAQLSLKDLDGFAVAAGPGSFTGLRIGLATMKALAYVEQKPLLAISTLDGLAANLGNQEGLICPILNAGKNEVYTALYRWESDDLQRISEYLAISPEGLLSILQKKQEQVTFLGDGVPIYGNFLQEKYPQARFTAATNSLCRASQIADLGLKKLQAGEIADTFTLEPIYIRASEAEVNWKKKNPQPDGGSVGI
ncbi:tRNA (adenosine(37)-N6)-threonylcarbamoyltransferase complex dimerization subunit type 1 TsaB [Bacillota bacterium LX-D]|nr:tRNA (adenosine(37)-N6)-threonylcarbamoyltransferase complex dimerization subunit type 1 TsaB [Bacillota bacterium LX-D]